VNFYKRFIGDITAKTGGLSLARMGAYDRLLDHFYSTELPIPPEEVYSICRAMTKADRTDVDAVLARFWTLTPTGHVQAKAEEVIAKARPLIDAARKNGKKGGRPKKENPEETQRVSVNNPEETQQEPSAKAIQSQSQTSPNGEEGKARKRAAPPRPEDVGQQVWDDWRALRAKKRADVSETTIAEARREADKAGVSLERFLTIWCLRGSQGLQAIWLTNEERQTQRVPNLTERRMATMAGLTNPGTNHGNPTSTIDVETRVVG
jgi:uncharacterized protein YdaU (DUF1376 family)